MHGLPIELYGAWPKVPKGRGDSDKKVLSFSFFRANNRDSSPLVSGENNLRPTSFPLQPAMLVSRLATSTSSVHGKTAQKGEREKKRVPRCVDLDGGNAFSFFSRYPFSLSVFV